MPTLSCPWLLHCHKRVNYPLPLLRWTLWSAALEVRIATTSPQRDWHKWARSTKSHYEIKICLKKGEAKRKYMHTLPTSWWHKVRKKNRRQANEPSILLLDKYDLVCSPNDCWFLLFAIRILAHCYASLYMNVLFFFYTRGYCKKLPAVSWHLCWVFPSLYF